MSSPPDGPVRRRYFAPRDSFVNGRPTVERDAWNVHLPDEVLVLDLSGAGRHKLMCLDVWALSMEWRSMLGLDGSAAG
jgi:hypothetical protein